MIYTFQDPSPDVAESTLSKNHKLKRKFTNKIKVIGIEGKNISPKSFKRIHQVIYIEMNFGNRE